MGLIWHTQVITIFKNVVYFFVILLLRRSNDVNIIHKIFRGFPKRVTILIFKC